MKRLGTIVAVVLALGCQGADDSGEAATGTPQAMAMEHLNPLITLHEQDLPVFGLYLPSAGGGRGRGGSAPPPVKSGSERASEWMAFQSSDFVFDGSMERSVDEALPAFREVKEALRGQGANAHNNPLIVKTVKISDDPEAAKAGIAQQLDEGVSGIMFVTVESAEELRTGLAAMRYQSAGGTRPDGDAGSAPAYWGVSEAEYREKADLWPLNPQGELISWVIVESHEGLANLREIAAVPGIGVLWPGAGTLRGVFSTTDANGQRVLDEAAWENAIQQVLSACKEFDIPCGFPANASDIETRMDQGFSVFVMGWGDSGFETVGVGRARAGR
jgi:4-hydroxy-2-oxoheptanedioate aldolase